jgi:hypothetical protein
MTESKNVGRRPMLKRLAALTITFAIIGSASVLADEWSEKFKILDTDGSGTISRVEWEDNVSKLKLDPAPTFTAMDEDVNNSVDAEEWAKAQKMAKAFPKGCKSSTSSWCEKQY